MAQTSPAIPPVTEAAGHAQNLQGLEQYQRGQQEADIAGLATYKMTNSSSGKILAAKSGTETWVGGTGTNGEYVAPHTRNSSGAISGPRPDSSIKISEKNELVRLLELKPTSNPAVFTRPGFRGQYILQKENDGSLSVYYPGGYHTSGKRCSAQTFHHGQWDLSRKRPGSMHSGHDAAPKPSPAPIPSNDPLVSAKLPAIPGNSPQEKKGKGKEVSGEETQSNNAGPQKTQGNDRGSSGEQRTKTEPSSEPDKTEQKEIAGLHAQIQNLQSQVEGLRAEVESERTASAERKQEIESLLGKLEEVERQRSEDQEGAKSRLDHVQSERQKQLAQEQAKQEGLEKELDDLRGKLEETTSELGATQSELQSMQEQLARQEKQHNAESVEQKEQRQQEQRKAEEREAALRETVAGLEKQVSSLTEKLQETQGELRQWPGKAQELQEKLSQQQRKQRETETMSKEELEQLREQLAKLQAELEKSEQEKEQTEAQRKQSEARVEELASELEKLQERLENVAVSDSPPSLPQDVELELEMQPPTAGQDPSEGFTVLTPNGERSPDGTAFPEQSDQATEPSQQNTSEKQTQPAQRPYYEEPTPSGPFEMDFAPQQNSQAEQNSSQQQQQEEQRVREERVEELQEKLAELSARSDELSEQENREKKLLANQLEEAVDELQDALGRDGEPLAGSTSRLLQDIDNYFQQGRPFTDDIEDQMVNDLYRETSFLERVKFWSNNKDEIRTWLNDRARMHKSAQASYARYQTRRGELSKEWRQYRKELDELTEDNEENPSM